MTHADLAWINSTGGPTVILPAAHAEVWTGAENLPGFEDELDGWGDYGTACRVDDWLGLVGYGAPVEGAAPQERAEFGPEGAPHRALVLGGEPLMSTYSPAHGIVLRWDCADSDEHMLAMLDQQLPRARWETAVLWDVERDLVMIDSACNLADYEDRDDERPVPIALAPGPYRVETAELASEDRSARAVVHRFVPA